jgi:hypothetical protein
MFERLNDNTVFVHGEIHHIDDHPDYWSPEDEQEHDEAVLDGIISNIHPHEHYDQVKSTHHYHDAEAALIAKSIIDHPASMNVSALQLGHLAVEIISRYQQNVRGLAERRKISSKARRDAVIAVMRNSALLSDQELRLLAHELGYPEDHFTTPVRAKAKDNDQREPDWRERQHKD